MEPIEIRTHAKGGKLEIDVPEELEGKELKVVITEAQADQLEEDTRKFHEMTVEERLKFIEQFRGTAKYPDYPVSKYDVYDQ